MTDRVRLAWRYRKGQRVHWAGDGGHLQVVVQQRVTRRDVLGDVYEYLLVRADEPQYPACWAREADVAEEG